MAKYISISNVIFIAILILLLTQGCRFDASEVKIERFEFLDVSTGKDDFKDERLKQLNNKRLSQAYIVYGYKKKYDIEINQLIDHYLCDSILPVLHFDERFYINFFKASRNTNREKFEERRSRRRITYAQSYDNILRFRLFHPNDSTTWITKQKPGFDKPLPPSEKIYCR